MRFYGVAYNYAMTLAASHAAPVVNPGHVHSAILNQLLHLQGGWALYVGDLEISDRNARIPYGVRRRFNGH